MEEQIKEFHELLDKDFDDYIEEDIRRYEKLSKDILEFKQKSNQKIVLVDIDGTLTIVGNRLQFLEAEDWDSFYAACGEDEPVRPIIELVQLLEKSYTIVYCTGRPEKVRNVTKKWLSYYVYGKPSYEIPDKNLLMRKDHDFRHDIIVKPEEINNAWFSSDQIEYILEDRDSMVAKWRELGFTCLQVAKGDF